MSWFSLFSDCRSRSDWPQSLIVPERRFSIAKTNNCNVYMTYMYICNFVNDTLVWVMILHGRWFIQILSSQSNSGSKVMWRHITCTPFGKKMSSQPWCTNTFMTLPVLTRREFWQLFNIKSNGIFYTDSSKLYSVKTFVCFSLRCATTTTNASPQVQK